MLRCADLDGCTEYRYAPQGVRFESVIHDKPSPLETILCSAVTPSINYLD
jgi:hypothetical protein